MPIRSQIITIPLNFNGGSEVTAQVNCDFDNPTEIIVHNVVYKFDNSEQRVACLRSNLITTGDRIIGLLMDGQNAHNPIRFKSIPNSIRGQYLFESLDSSLARVNSGGTAFVTIECRKQM